jgi:hypothetical protein
VALQALLYRSLSRGAKGDDGGTKC